MKKSVAVISVLAVFAFILILVNSYNTLTGAQVLDLPPPPDLPGMTSNVDTADTSDKTEEKTKDTEYETKETEKTTQAEQILQVLPDEELENVEARLRALEFKLQVLDLMPQFENRLNTVEQLAALGDTSRLDSLEAKIAALEVKVANVEEEAGRPMLQVPAMLDPIEESLSKTSTISILSLVLSVLVSLIVAFLIYGKYTTQKKEHDENVNMISNYIKTYKEEGHSVDELKQHLMAAGWDEKIIEEANIYKGSEHKNTEKRLLK
jgi:competence protein ComGC